MERPWPRVHGTRQSSSGRAKALSKSIWPSICGLVGYFSLAAKPYGMSTTTCSATAPSRLSTCELQRSSASSEAVCPIHESCGNNSFFYCAPVISLKQLQFGRPHRQKRPIHPSARRCSPPFQHLQRMTFYRTQDGELSGLPSKCSR